MLTGGGGGRGRPHGERPHLAQASEGDLSNFDPELTGQPLQDESPNEAATPLSPSVQAQFVDFAYTEPSPQTPSRLGRMLRSPSGEGLFSVSRSPSGANLRFDALSTM